MSSIGAMTFGQSGIPPSIEPAKNTQEGPAANKASKADKEEAPPLTEGVKVTISGAALKAASASKNENSDIEDSGLPENIQSILKMIRAIKKKIAEQMAKLQAIMTNRSLSPEQARTQSMALQAEVAGLNASLTSANNSLNKALQESGASSESIVKAASLAMK